MIGTRLKLGILFLFSWAVFQGAYLSGNHYRDQAQIQAVTGSIEKRIALDLPKLRLANPKFGTVAHEQSIVDYSRALNAQLAAVGAKLRIQSLQGIKVDDFDNALTIERTLSTADLEVPLALARTHSPISDYVSLLAALLAALVTFAGRPLLDGSAKLAISAAEPDNDTPVEVKLIINLHDKSISNGQNDTRVILSNKPFCFYLALVDYCLKVEEPYLNHNNEVPEEILQLANKYFYRLIELGHTKRKRPDFSTNLDKTLSEIRSTLDEVFHDFVDAKDIFFPPKAQGEGSRSKKHNYALEHLTPELVEIIGK